MTYSSVFSLALGATFAGRTLKAQFATASGQVVGVAITSGFAEIGAGNYLWSATLADDFRGAVLFEDAADSTVLAVSAINPEEMNPFTSVVPGSYAYGSAGAALGSVSAAAVTSVRAVDATGNVGPLLRGDDYLASTDNPLDWTSAGWPTLTGGSILFSVRRGQDVPWTKAGAVTGPTAVRVELSAAETEDIGAGMFVFDLQATLGGGVTTLLVGSLRILEDVR